MQRATLADDATKRHLSFGVGSTAEDAANDDAV
jgi:hypothetical protein